MRVGIPTETKTMGSEWSPPPASIEELTRRADVNLRAGERDDALCTETR
jgi:hypothetical protein